MLRSVVGAVAANMMLVQCSSDVPISLACSSGVGNRPDCGIIGSGLSPDELFFDRWTRFSGDFSYCLQLLIGFDVVEVDHGRRLSAMFEGELWFLAPDVCRVLGYLAGANGTPN
jgi:hypothetical protein